MPNYVRYNSYREALLKPPRPCLCWAHRRIRDNNWGDPTDILIDNSDDAVVRG